MSNQCRLSPVLIIFVDFKLILCEQRDSFFLAGQIHLPDMAGQRRSSEKYHSNVGGA